MNKISLEIVLNLYAPLVERYARTNMQMAPEQYAHLASVIYARSPCALLVFGCGLDSPLWHELNHGGQTVFIEDNDRWQHAIESAGLTVIKVRYESQIGIWLDDIRLPCGLPHEVIDAHWEIVVVDAPLGMGANPGREQSIYTAAHLRETYRSVVYVHDYDRAWERACCDKYLGNPTDCIANLAVWESTNRKKTVS